MVDRRHGVDDSGGERPSVTTPAGFLGPLAQCQQGGARRGGPGRRLADWQGWAGKAASRTRCLFEQDALGVIGHARYPRRAARRLSDVQLARVRTDSSGSDAVGRPAHWQAYLAYSLPRARLGWNGQMSAWSSQEAAPAAGGKTLTDLGRAPVQIVSPSFYPPLSISSHVVWERGKGHGNWVHMTA